jgi:hypothetical protein
MDRALPRPCRRRCHQEAIEYASIGEEEEEASRAAEGTQMQELGLGRAVPAVSAGLEQ